MGFSSLYIRLSAPGLRRWPRFLLVVISSLLTMPTIVQADVSGLYSLARVGSLSVDNLDAADQTIIGFVLGQQISGGFYIEGELNLPVAGGEYVISDGLGSTGELRLSSVIVHGVYRYVINDLLYAKAKLGAAYEDIANDKNNSAAGGPAADVESSGSFEAAGGLGLGFVLRLGKTNHPVMLEVEVASFDADVIMYTIGMTSPF